MKGFKITFLALTTAVSYILVSCNSKPDKISKVVPVADKKAKVESQTQSCIITKPVDEASDIHKPQDIEDTFLSDSDFKQLLGSILESNIEIDSSSIYTTHMDFQKEIVVQKECIVDKAFGEKLMEEYFVSDFIYDEINLTKSENKKILNFGDAIIYEYEIIGGSEYNPHNIILILKDNGRDFFGISFCSDGMRWERIVGESYLPLFVERVRLHKQYEIPMLYLKNKFVPLGHYKIPGLWEED